MIFAGTELLGLSGVAEGLSVEFVVTEHLAKLGVGVGAVH